MSDTADGGQAAADAELALPEVAAAVADTFGGNAEAARTYADMLRGDGITRGLLGPAEADRVWRRHILNCAALARLIPAGARVIDLGSGAGLPGIPIALARSDLTVVLLEPMRRRTLFLQDCLERLQLPGLSVHHGRSEDGGVAPADVVVARAVASLERLMRLSTPLLVDNGSILALKGRSVSGEVDEVRRYAGVRADVLSLPAPEQPATVVWLRGIPRHKPARRAARAARSSR